MFLAAILASSLGPIGSEPARQPQLAATGSTVVLTFGAGNSIYVSLSRDAGRSFSAPSKITQSVILPLTRHRGPRVVISSGVILVSAVAGKTPSVEQHAHGLPSDGDLIVWRSTDWGKSWSSGTVINDSPGAANEGLHSLATDGKGGVLAAWLDKRSGKGTELYMARSLDNGLTWSPNVRLYHSPDATICECCHPSAALDTDGQAVVIWRNWLNGSRDLYVTRSPDGVHFSRPEKLGSGTWKLNACPMDGGGLVIFQGKPVTAWRREETVYLAEPGQNEVAIGAGKDIAIAGGSKGVYVAWIREGAMVLRRPDGRTEVLSTEAAFPSLAAIPGGPVLAAWEQGAEIVVRTLD
jgi:hypothetical protein